MLNPLGDSGGGGGFGSSAVQKKTNDSLWIVCVFAPRFDQVSRLMGDRGSFQVANPLAEEEEEEEEDFLAAGGSAEALVGLDGRHAELKLEIEGRNSKVDKTPPLPCVFHCLRG